MCLCVCVIVVAQIRSFRQESSTVGFQQHLQTETQPQVNKNKQHYFTFIFDRHQWVGESEGSTVGQCLFILYTPSLLYPVYTQQNNKQSTISISKQFQSVKHIISKRHRIHKAGVFIKLKFHSFSRNTCSLCSYLSAFFFWVIGLSAGVTYFCRGDRRQTSVQWRGGE